MSRTMIIAELSGNHNNDLQYTKDSLFYEIKEVRGGCCEVADIHSRFTDA